MAIKLENVSAAYGRDTDILKNMTLSLEGKDIVLGPNGSGKTTLFRTILGLSVGYKGQVQIDSFEAQRIFGKPNLLATNMEEVYKLLRVPVKMLADLYLELGDGDKSYFSQLVHEFDLVSSLEKRIDELSSGQRRLLCDMIAFGMNSRYTLLDEPFENLDPARRAMMARLVKEKGDKVIMNTHATWLLDKFQDWKAVLMFNGNVFGPIIVEKLLSASLIEGRVEGAELSFKVEQKEFSLSQDSKGVKLTSMDSLDRLFELGL